MSTAHLLKGLYEEHVERVLRVCMKFARGDKAWAMDRTHDVFVRLADHLDRLDTRDLGGWLYRVAVNTCFMHLRRQRRWLGVFARLSPPTPGVGPDHALLAGRDRDTFAAALASLPPKEQVLITLMYLEDKSLTEAAELLGYDKGYVSRLHQRALGRLRKRKWELGHG